MGASDQTNEAGCLSGFPAVISLLAVVHRLPCLAAAEATSRRASPTHARILRKSTSLAGQQAALHLDPPDTIIPDDDPATLHGSGYSLQALFSVA
jgi:hypothetical protein